MWYNKHLIELLKEARELLDGKELPDFKKMIEWRKKVDALLKKEK